MEYPEIIIDTNVFIEHQRKQNKKNSKLTWLVENYDIVTTAITVYELFAGAVTTRHEEDIRNLLFGVKILGFDSESAEIAAKERLRLLKQNKQFEIRDILIAGIAIKHQIPLATLNIKHFVDFINIELVSMEVNFFE
jgi:tRNA(fMet)-specific endonuclease VapC